MRRTRTRSSSRWQARRRDARSSGSRRSPPSSRGATVSSTQAQQTPIVLLHGVGLDRTMWAPVEALLGERAVALDLPGHGAQPPLRAPTSLADFAADIERRLPDGPIHLVGFSLGALAAQHIASRAPERVATLTCVSSVCRRTPDERAAVLERLASAGTDFGATVERSLERWYSGSGVSASTIAETRRVLEANDVESFGHAYEIFATGDQQVSDALGAITAPTLAITGELDPGSTPDMTRRLADAIPGTRTQVVPGVRHMLPVEAPSTLVDELEALIGDAELSIQRHHEGAHHD
ncbi:alpha/beta fold hydrolase [Pseudoclavibacter sp. Marseille-Q4354]|nr:alpha/beta fold hydrolase [Pseudoclavibacter sp. Marseille-Q4354]